MRNCNAPPLNPVSDVCRVEVRRSLIVASDPLKQSCADQMEVGVIGFKPQRCFDVRDSCVEFCLPG